MSLKKVITLVGFALLTAVYFLFLNSVFNKAYKLKTLDYEQKQGILYSENAFYYKFYSELATAEDWRGKIREFRSYDRVMYPEKVDAIGKYNITPEIFLAKLYRVVNGLKEIDLFDFYVLGSMVIVALTAGGVFLLVMEMTGSWVGGLTAVFFLILAFPFSSRIIDYPALRENFGIPTLVFQVWFLCRLTKQNNRHVFIWYFLGTMVHVLFWQFSQFTLLAEILILLFIYLVGGIKNTLFKKVSFLNLVAIILIFLLYMRNVDLVKSLFFCLNLSILVILNLPLNRMKRTILLNLFVLFGTFVLMGVIYLVFGFFGGKSVGHVFQYFSIQLFNKEPDFHSVLYKCSGAFEKMNLLFLEPLIRSWLLPVTGLGLLGVVFMKIKIKPEYWFLGGMAIIYFCFGFIANRFIVLALPFLCAIAGIVLSGDYIRTLFGKDLLIKRVVYVFMVFFLGINFWRLIGETKGKIVTMQYSANFTDLEVVRWINKFTEKEAVFAGVMPMTSKILLMSDRKIANNPYYEDELNRQKTWEMYRIYGKESEEGFVEYLNKNKVDYYVINNYQCNYRDRNGCVAEDMYKQEDRNSDEPILCRKNWTESKKLKEVFDNKNYKILKILK